MCLIDVVVAYMHGSLDNDICMKKIEGFEFPYESFSKPNSIYTIKLK